MLSLNYESHLNTLKYQRKLVYHTQMYALLDFTSMSVTKNIHPHQHVGVGTVNLRLILQ